MNYSNFSVFNNDEKTKEKIITNSENKRGNENFGLNREVLFSKETNKNYLNDRDMFFKISNNTEDIDTTDNKFCDYSGMPIKNMQILNVFEVFFYKINN